MNPASRVGGNGASFEAVSRKRARAVSAKGRPERELRPLWGQRSGVSRKRGGTTTPWR
jgi:hypothetical protein